MWHVKLVEPRVPFPIRFADFLNRRTPRRRETVRQVQLAGYFRDSKFGGWVVDLVYPDWREADRCGHAVPEDLGCCVAVVCVHELVGDYAVPVEGLPVCEVCC